MKIPFQLDPVKDGLRNAKTVLVVIPQNPQVDWVAAGLAWYLSLNKLDINVSVACPSDMTVTFNRLFGVDKISKKIGNRNLVISFDYVKDSIEKVSYNIEDDKFNLVVEPKEGKPALNKDKVEYSYTGAAADLVIICGGNRLLDMAEFAQKEEELFRGEQVIHFNTQVAEAFATHTLTDEKAVGVSEIVSKVFQQLEMPVDSDTASNLMAGIEMTSSKLASPKTSADTLKVAAFLMDKGAKRGLLDSSRPSVSPAAAFGLKSKSKKTQKSTGKKTKKTSSGNKPPDWYKPKVFTGNTQV